MELWRRLACSHTDLLLVTTLSGGQCFRWHKNKADEWTGVFANRVWILKQMDDHLLYKVVYAENLENNGTSIKKRKAGRPSRPTGDSFSTSEGSPQNFESTRAVEDEALLKEYFRLDVTLSELYEKWSECDPNFRNIAIKFHGVRMLKQDPVENLFSFICSSNNHISRISSMVEKLCKFYGRHLCTVDNIPYHSFPTVESLADTSVEQTLRDAGFGYRAKFIQQSALKIKSMGGTSWLSELQSKSYDDAKLELMKLPGIGAKVADCICLMSLNHLQAIPVDTHVWQISCRYLPHLKSYKSVTDRVYKEIGNYFRDLYGPLAGWAHTVLFCADLKMFQDSPVAGTKRKANPTEASKKKSCPTR